MLNFRIPRQHHSGGTSKTFWWWSIQNQERCYWGWWWWGWRCGGKVSCWHVAMSIPCYWGRTALHWQSWWFVRVSLLKLLYIRYHHDDKADDRCEAMLKCYTTHNLDLIVINFKLACNWEWKLWLVLAASHYRDTVIILTLAWLMALSQHWCPAIPVLTLVTHWSRSSITSAPLQTETAASF